MSMPEFNFVHPSRTKEEIEFFLGPFEEVDGPFFTIEPEWTMADIMFKVGTFPSRTQARKNGWDKPIPKGFNEIRSGKGRNHKIIWILGK